MAVLMVMGIASGMPKSVLDPAGTMTSIIAGTLGWGYSDEMIRHALFAIALILFVFVFILNVLIFTVRRRIEEHTLDQWFLIKYPRNLITKVSNYLASFNEKRIVNRSTKKNDTNLIEIMLPTRKLNRSDLIMRNIILGCTLIIVGFLLFILLDIVIHGGAAITWQMISQHESNGGVNGGFLNAIVGSFYLVALGLLIALPLALGAAIYINEYANKKNRWTRVIIFSSNTLASTPSIVFGAFGFIFLVTYLGFRFSLLAGGITLALMMIPLIFGASLEAIRSVPGEYREASFALGATKWKTVRNTTLPVAFPGITSGAILAIGRAIGETAAILFTAGYTALIVDSLFMPAASMPNLIYNYFELSVKFPSLMDKIYSAAFLLIIFILILNFVARQISKRSQN